jgi:nitroreductase
VFVISDRFRRKPGAEPAANYNHSFDAGAAWAHLALQAHHLGWAAHGMGGFDKDAVYPALGLDPAQHRVEAAVAVGRPADPASLADGHADRQPRSPRAPVADFVSEGRFQT